jgi:hypothetical protein
VGQGVLDDVQSLRSEIASILFIMPPLALPVLGPCTGVPLRLAPAIASTGIIVAGRRAFFQVGA